ncbi:MAG: hypothetical protein QOD75_2135 [Blastocatellia bacterium]|jgi:hypothetical protein|nr:hypothetical protein [Blastocatellia bacterium]
MVAQAPAEIKANWVGTPFLGRHALGALNLREAKGAPTEERPYEPMVAFMIRASSTGL